MHRTAVKQVVLESVLDANDALAQANRERFDQAGTYVINLMSSPGAGKTTLLERTLEHLRGELRLGVLEGDVQTTLDADRLARFHIPLVQVNTDPGFGGECHLDANMVRSGLPELSLSEIDVLVIENVGNLVCPAEFKVGEDTRVMVYSVTEGEEKPLKYPLMFRSADLVLVNKVDLLEHLDFDLDQFLGNLDAVNPGVERVLTSARTGQGVEEWCSWLERRKAGRGDQTQGQTT
jgi:hydrogenase nickel incorporation protein HypB